MIALSSQQQNGRAAVGAVYDKGEKTLTKGIRQPSWRMLTKIVRELLDQTIVGQIICDRQVAENLGDVGAELIVDPSSELYEVANRAARARLWGAELSTPITVAEEVSSDRAQLIHIAAKESGYTEAGLRHMLAEYGAVSATEVTKDHFNRVLKKARSEALATVYNDKVDPNLITSNEQHHDA